MDKGKKIVLEDLNGIGKEPNEIAKAVKYLIDHGTDKGETEYRLRNGSRVKRRDDGFYLVTKD